jgi:hypothetical protein
MPLFSSLLSYRDLASNRVVKRLSHFLRKFATRAGISDVPRTAGTDPGASSAVLKVCGSSPMDTQRPRTYQTGPRYAGFAPNYRSICAFSAKKPDRLSSIIAELVYFRPKSPINYRSLCHSPLFFIHIVGSIFIFNIFMGQRPVSDLEKHINEPPQLAQAGIFHPLHDHRVFVVGSHQSVADLGESTNRGTSQAEPR